MCLALGALEVIFALFALLTPRGPRACRCENVVGPRFVGRYQGAQLPVVGIALNAQRGLMNEHTTTLSMATLLLALSACAPAPQGEPVSAAAARPAPTTPTTPTTPTAALAAGASPNPSQDVHSYAVPSQARVTHLALDLTPDFKNKTLSGAAALWITRAAGVTEVVLDDRGLLIEAVYDVEGRDLPYTIGTDDPVLGAPLRITLPSPVAGGDKTHTRITIKYHTRPDAQALQWLTPAQTASLQQPFLFTQGQAILTRTWIPLQDSPGIRFTYEAQITVPKGMSAVMSAEGKTEGLMGRAGAVAGKVVDDKRVFTFEMAQSIPSYLVALAVGDIAFQKLSERTGVYADPTVIAAAAAEFADTEKMVVAAEALYGPYRWGRYDILVLPPSFPYGGMENPRLTFVSPTAIAGDRSLVSLIAHELAHSWSGNLVTNATWSDMWLNEGTTVYFEDRIVEEIYGLAHAHMNQVLGWQDLLSDMEQWGKDSEKSKLWRPLPGQDPDEALNGVPYTKGSAFLRSIEGVVGRVRFDAFLKRYFETNKFSSMTTSHFLELVQRDLVKTPDELRALHLQAWAYDVGIPPGFVPPTSQLLDKVNADVARMVAGAAPSSVDTKAYTALQLVHLLKNLPRVRSAEQMKAMDQTWACNKSGNSEVLFEWLRLVIANHDLRSLKTLEHYLRHIGRRRLVLPLYEDLAKTPWGAALAARIFTQAKASYHPLTVSSVEEALAAPQP